MTTISLDNLRTIKGFVKADIERELQLAKVSSTFLRYVLDFLGINRGGGNMMAVLALIDYTEFAGHVYAQINHLTNYGPFTTGFEQMIPSDYKKLSKSPSDIRTIIRNSILYPVDDDDDYSTEVAVGMLENNFCEKHSTNASIAYDGKMWYFCVEKYYKDLMDVFDQLEKQLIVQN